MELRSRDPSNTSPRGAFSWRPRTVDFYLYSSHEVAVWEPLWRRLRQRGIDAEVVLESPGIHRAVGSVPNPALGWRNEKDTDVVPLVDEATFVSLADLLDRRGIPWIEHSRVDADAVVTTQGVGWLQHYRGQRIKIEYGASAFVDVYGHGPINEGLDAVLAHGPFSARAITAHLPSDRIHIVGYPKWAPARRDNLTRSQARDELGLPGTQPIVAWLPTWAHNAGIDTYAPALAQLADRYLVVAKPHHNNVRFETERLAAIDPRIIVRADLHSLVSLMVAADVVVADSRSGALAESFLADRPAVGLLPGVGPRENGVIAGLEDAVVWCQEPGALNDAIADALSTDRSTARHRWRPWLFDAAPTADDERAADTVIALIERGHTRPSSGLPLSRLDAEIDDMTGADPSDFLFWFARAWSLWPGHPRLAAALAGATPDLDHDGLIMAARLVRTSGHADICPIVDTLEDDHADPVRRLVATAVAAELFEAPMQSLFVTLAGVIDPDRFGDALLELGNHVPGAIPAFIECAATTAARCATLAAALRHLGAEEQAAALLTHLDLLVPT